MDEQTYPYQAWALTERFNVKEVTITKEYKSVQSMSYVVSSTGKLYHKGELFPTKLEAINQGHVIARQQQAKLQRAQENLLKRIANLNKAMENT